MNTTSSLLQRIRSGVGGRRQGVILSVGLLAVAAAIVILLSSLPVTFFENETAGVWVVDNRQSPSQVGRLNTLTNEIDSVTPVDDRVEVRQDGAQTWLITGEDGSERKVGLIQPGERPGGPVAADSDTLGGDTKFRVGGGSTAELTSGSLTVTRDAGSDTPTPVRVELGGDDSAVGDGALLELGVDGTAAVWDPAAEKLWTLEPDSEDASETDVGPVAEGTGVELTLVGSRPVLLDRAANRLWSDGDWRDVSGPARLQLPGPERRDVVVAASDRLLAVPLVGDGDAPLGDAPSGAGDPLRPAVDDECTFAAWVGAAPLAVCGERTVEGGPVVVEGDGFVSGRPAGVLTRPNEGEACSIRKAQEEWVCAKFPDLDSETRPDEKPELDDRKFGQNTPPVAVADTGIQGLKARPDRSSKLDVLRNDWDLDRDPLAVVSVTPGEEQYADRFSIQAGNVLFDSRQSDGKTVKELGVGTTIGFKYVLTDGRSTALEEGVAQVRIVPDSENSGPALIGDFPPEVRLGVGRPVDVDVVGRFSDPEDDPIILQSVVSADTTRLAALGDRSSGFVNLRAAVALPAPVTVTATVVDAPPPGPGPVEATAALQVTAEQEGEPVTNNDSIVVTPGQTNVRARVLSNDVNVGGDNADLELISDGLVLEAGGKVGLERLRVEDNEVVFDVPGTTKKGDYANITYAVRSGERNSQGKLLATITDGQGTVTVRNDVVVVNNARSQLVDLLRNDEVSGDPDALLAIGEVKPPVLEPAVSLPKLGVNRDLRSAFVDGGSARPGTYRFEYCVVYRSDDDCGKYKGAVIVVVEAGRADRTPRAQVTPVVRQVPRDGVARVPIEQMIANPDQVPLPLTIESEPASGSATLDGAALRFSAGGTQVGTTVEVVIAGTTPDLTAVSATAKFTVTEKVEIPRPPDLQARVRLGDKVVIPVPVDLPIQLDSLTSVTSTGSEQKDGAGYTTIDQEQQALVFTAPDDPTLAGQYQFALRTRNVLTDERSKETGTVRVLVLPQKIPTILPVARDDIVVVGGRGEVVFDPIANDSLPTGGELRLDDTKDAIRPTGCKAEPKEASGNRVLLRIFDVPDTGCTIIYRALAPSGESQATITVRRNKEFTGSPPVLRDDVARQDKRQETALVAVLANDEDPDGAIEEVELTLPGNPAEATVRDGNKVQVTFSEQSRIVTYRVQDVDGNTAEAFLFVPSAAANRYPQLKADAQPVVISKDRTPVSVDLTQYIEDPDGDTWEVVAITPDPVFESMSPGKQLTLTMRDTNALVSGERRLQVKVADPGDPDGEGTTIGVPIRIEPKENTPPQWTGPISCPDIEEKLGTSAPVDVSAFLYDPDPIKDFVIEATATGAATVTTSGASYVLTATENGRAGDSYSLTVKAGNKGSPPEEWVTAPCTGSLSKTKTAVPVGKPGSIELKQGESVNRAAAELVIQDPRVVDSPLVVESATAQTTVSPVRGGQSASCAAGGSGVQFSAVRGGKATCTINIKDTFERSVTVSVSISVSGPPDPPVSVTAEAVDAGSAATLNIAAGDNNFGQNPRFAITAVGGPSNAGECSSATCTVGGLKNGATYTFSVKAVNDAGESDSVQSGPVTPDVAPRTPTGLRAEELDGKVVFTWSDGGSDGTATSEYFVNGASNGLSTSFEQPVRNGEEFCITVVASNESGSKGKGKKSAPTPEVCGTPFGNPTGQPNVNRAAENGKLYVSWSGSGNGRKANGSVAMCGTSQTITVPATGEGSGDLEFDCGGVLGQRQTAVLTLSSINDRTVQSTSTSSLIPYKTPTIDCNGVTVEAGYLEALLAGECTVTDNGTGAKVTYKNVQGLPAFVAATVLAEACGAPNGSLVCSGETTIGTVTPWGPPTGVTVTCSRPIHVSNGEYSSECSVSSDSTGLYENETTKTVNRGDKSTVSFSGPSTVEGEVCVKGACTSGSTTLQRPAPTLNSASKKGEMVTISGSDLNGATVTVNGSSVGQCGDFRSCSFGVGPLETIQRISVSVSRDGTTRTVTDVENPTYVQPPDSTVPTVPPDPPG